MIDALRFLFFFSYAYCPLKVHMHSLIVILDQVVNPLIVILYRFGMHSLIVILDQVVNPLIVILYRFGLNKQF